MIEGTIELRIDGKEPRHLSAGGPYATQANPVHQFTDVGDKPVRVLNTLEVEKGKPRTAAQPTTPKRPPLSIASQPASWSCSVAPHTRPSVAGQGLHPDGNGLRSPSDPVFAGGGHFGIHIAHRTTPIFSAGRWFERVDGWGKIEKDVDLRKFDDAAAAIAAVLERN